MNYNIFKLNFKKSTDMCVVKLKARREEVRRKIPDMTGRKGKYGVLRSCTEGYGGVRSFTERYGAVRRGTEKSDISFLLPLQFLFPLLRLQITPSVILRYPP